MFILAGSVFNISQQYDKTDKNDLIITYSNFAQNDAAKCIRQGALIIPGTNANISYQNGRNRNYLSGFNNRVFLFFVFLSSGYYGENYKGQTI
jgi:hypothetical protein